MRKHKCQKCAKCCHAFGITFSWKDLNREPRLREVAVPIYQVNNPRTRRFMLEKKHPWAIRKRGRGAACLFLDSNNECLIYDTRPQVCRDYPGKGYCIREMQEIQETKEAKKR